MYSSSIEGCSDNIVILCENDSSGPEKYSKIVSLDD